MQTRGESAKQPGRMRRFIRTNAALLAVIFSIVCLRTAVADWSYVPSGSMEPTFYDGDWLIVNKTYYGPTIPFTSVKLFSIGEPERGDVITFYPPHTDELYVKRVIGIPGDRILVRGSDIFVNGEKLAVSELHNDGGRLIGFERIGNVRHRIQFSEGGQLPTLNGEIVVPDGKYFVLGDHRNNSADSRYWGFVDEAKITGRVTYIAVSFADERPLSHRFAIPID